jgi:hypothetical protein
MVLGRIGLEYHPADCFGGGPCVEEGSGTFWLFNEITVNSLFVCLQIAHSLETLREKVVALISAHPKANASSDLKALFDQTIGLSFNTKKNKIVFGWIKK